MPDSQLLDGKVFSIELSGDGLEAVVMEMLEGGKCVPLATFVDAVYNEKLPYCFSNQKNIVRIKGVSVEALGFRFGARPVTVLARAAERNLGPVSASIALHFAKRFAETENYEASDWYHLPLDRTVELDSSGGRDFRSNFLELFCETLSHLDDVELRNNPLSNVYEAIQPEEQAGRSFLQLTIPLRVKEWFRPDDILFFVLLEE